VPKKKCYTVLTQCVPSAMLVSLTATGQSTIYVVLYNNTAVAQMESASLHFSRYTVRFLMRAGFGGLSSWWQQGIGSGHSTWALTVHVRHPMCVRCKE
jgi:hypothetical protein